MVLVPSPSPLCAENGGSHQDLGVRRHFGGATRIRRISSRLHMTSATRFGPPRRYLARALNKRKMQSLTDLFYGGYLLAGGLGDKHV